MLADGNFAAHFAWAMSAYPQRAAFITLHRQGRIVQPYVMLGQIGRVCTACWIRKPSGAEGIRRRVEKVLALDRADGRLVARISVIVD